MVVALPYIAGQISYLLAALDSSNYDAVVHELKQLTDAGGLDGSMLLLRSCLEEVDDAQGGEELKLELLKVVVKHLLCRPNFATIFCQALKHVSFLSEDVLEDLSKTLQLTLAEQIRLGLAMTQAEDATRQLQGQDFCWTKLNELSQNASWGNEVAQQNA